MRSTVSTAVIITQRIVIGENFSESMYGFADNDLVHPSVTYYENEKKNPIASKITDTAKGTPQTSINEEFVNVCSFHCYGKYE